ncbi:MAG: restriction endonuclease subunit S, partial [Patescibacteria group bacterium]
MTQTKAQQLNSTSVKTSADKPQTFTVWSNEIEGRIDPYFYKPWKYNFKGILLSNFIDKITSGKYVSRDKFMSNGVSYLRVQNLKDDGIEVGDLFLSNNEKVSETNQETFLTGRVGSLGTFRMARDKYFYSDNILSIEFKKDKNINLEYLEIVLNSDLAREQIEKNCKGNNQKLISQETIRNLKIPLPPLSTQNKIVEIMAKAYQEKKEKEAEAGKLLESIDDYVLNELGIQMSEIKKEMIF